MVKPVLCLHGTFLDDDDDTPNKEEEGGREGKTLHGERSGNVRLIHVFTSHIDVH